MKWGLLGLFSSLVQLLGYRTHHSDSLAAGKALRRSAFPGAFVREELFPAQRSQACLLLAATSLLRLWSPSHANPPHQTHPLLWPHCRPLWLTEGRHTAKYRFQVPQCCGLTPLPQCICVHHTGLLVVPQTHLTLCSHIVASSAPFLSSCQLPPHSSSLCQCQLIWEVGSDPTALPTQGETLPAVTPSLRHVPYHRAIICS